MEIYYFLYYALHSSYNNFSGVTEVMICDHGHPTGRNTSHRRIVFSEKKEILEKIMKNRKHPVEIKSITMKEEDFYDLPKFWKNQYKQDLVSGYAW